MATITGMTAARMLAIEAESIVAARIDGTGHLILTNHAGVDFNVGEVVGPQGSTGPPGPAGAISVQHDDAGTITELIIDFEDGGGITWTLTDDPTNNRVKLSGAVAPIPAPATTVQGPAAYGDQAAVGVSTTNYARADHKHGLPAAPPSIVPATTVDGPDAFGSAPAVGGSVKYAREDHKHGLPAAAGAMTLISSQVLAAAAASVTFSAIPQTYNHLILKAQARSSSASPDAYEVQLNGDGNANYDGQGIILSAGSWVAGAFTAAIAWGNGQQGYRDLIDSGATVGASSVLTLEILNYASTVFRKIGSFSSGYSNPDFQGSFISDLKCQWRSTVAVTSIRLYVYSASTFAAGSVFQLYGLT